MNQMKDQHDMLQAITGSIAAFMGLDGHAAKEAAQIAMENNSAGTLLIYSVMGLIEYGALSPQAVRALQVLLRNSPFLYKVAKDGQNKSQQQANDDQQKPSGSGGEDPGDKDPKNPKKPDGNFKTPEDPKYENMFEKYRKAFRNKKDGSMWEKDKAGHGGEQWKRWDNIRAWKKRQDPNSIWPDGRVRK